MSTDPRTGRRPPSYDPRPRHDTHAFATLLGCAFITTLLLMLATALPALDQPALALAPAPAAAAQA